MKKWVSLIVVMLLVFSSFDWRVLAEADTEAPKLISYSIAEGDYTIGDSVPIEVVIEDETMEGLGLLLYLERPISGKSHQVTLTRVSEGVYRGNLSILDGMEPGRYVLDHLYLLDKWSNSRYVYRESDDTQGFSVSGTTSDIEAPTLVSYSIADGDYTVGDSVPIEVVIEDETMEGLGLLFYLERPISGKAHQVSLTRASEGVYRGNLSILDGMEPGRYVLDHLYLLDKWSNSRYVYREMDDVTGFNLYYEQTDFTSPEFKGIKSINVEVDETETTSFFIAAYDDEKLKSAEGTFTHENGETITLSSETVTSTGFDFPVSYDSLRSHPGQWKLTSLTISDLNQNTVTVTEGLDVTINVLPTIEPVNARIVSGYEYWSYETVNQDVYVLPGAQLDISSNVQINGDVYVGGRLRSYGGLELNGDMRASYFTFGYYNPSQDGMVVLSGSNSVNSMTATNQLYGTLPFRLSGAPLFEENGTVDVAGSFIPLSKLYLNGEAVTMKANGIFRLTDVVVPEDKTLRFSMTDQYGKTHRWTYKVYSRDLPVVTASLPSGIYPKGDSVTLEATKDATIYYTLNENAESLTYGGPIQLDSSVTIAYHAVDEIELASASETKRYEVFNVHAVENDDEAIRGQAEPGTALTLTLGESTYTTTATPDGTFAFTNLTLDSHGEYELNLQHGLLQSQPYTGVIKDVIAPIITGVTNDAYTSSAITLTFNEGVATLNGQPVSSGTKVTADGAYTLIVTDQSGNTTIRQFTIDTKAPVVSGISSRYTNKDVTLSFDEGSATLNGRTVASGTTVSTEGDYELVVRDKAGNETKASFTIDRTPVAVTGAEEGKAYQQTKLQFTEGKATLNGQAYVSDALIEAEGTYVFQVTDLAGNVTTINFIIDRTVPNVSGVNDGGLYNKPVTLTFDEGTATLNGNAFVSGQAINQDGTYELVVTDAANNVTKRSFRIDQTAPIVTGVKAGAFNRSVTPTFGEGTATLNGKAYTSGTVIDQEGTYELIVTDEAKNVTRVPFTLDWSPVVVSGVESDKHYPLATPMFAEGTATLNGQPFTSGTSISKDGVYTLVVTDGANNVTTVRFTVDHVAPVVTGVASQGYNRAVTPLFTEGTATLNGKPYTSGTAVSTEGKYELIVTDAAGNTTRVQFHLDFTQVAVNGVENGKTYQRATISFTEGTATLNGNAISTGTVVTKEGNYELIVRDEVGNKSIIRFTIDTTAPNVTGVKDTMTYQQVTPVFSEGTATLNGRPFQSGTTVTEEGMYQLIVRDEAGNEAVVRFTIDRTKPIISGVTNGKTVKEATVTFNEGTATLNGQPFKTGSKVDTEGKYELVVTDVAGNRTTLQFSIDRTGPTVKGVEMNKVYNQLQPTFDEGIALLNGKSFVSGTRITTEGLHELVVTDKTGNQTIIRFTVDTTPVSVVGVEDGKTYKQVLPTFSEGTVTLNGQPYESGQPISEDGPYTLVATDTAGNETIIRFTIDNTPPVLTGFTTGKSYYRSVAPRFDEGTATLNGEPYTSGKLISQPGKYTLRLSDATGNETVTVFTIDRTAPVISGVKSRQVTNQTVTIQYNEGTATLNGKRIRNNWPVKNSGVYTLRVTDKAGNVKLLTFTIDKTVPTKPTISTLTNKSTLVFGKAEKGATVYITYNGRTYTTKASSKGLYRYKLKTSKAGATVSVRAKDAAGNMSSTASRKVLNTFRTFSVNSVKSTSNVITGKGNKGATVKAYVGTKLISKTAKVDSKGNYKLTISRQKPGVTVTVKMTQSGYQELKKTTRVVK